jgi:hypothetical protein
MSPKDYILDLGNNLCITAIIQGATGGSGVGGGSDTGLPLILGESFLRGSYSIYDRGSGRIGFAKAVHPTTV